MEVYTSPDDIRHALREERRNNRSVAFVPTMGYLHDGHMSLVREGRRRANVMVVSIFVNPTQFGPNEDFETYPRDLEADLSKCRAAGVRMVFTPTVTDMYPEPSRTHVHVDGLTTRLCGAHRPGHFDGVTTVVTKLFNIVQPNVALFGEKDYQQLAVIRRMVRDLNVPVEIIGVPTSRERDGLARSSRNARLTTEQRAQAPILYKALCAMRDQVANGVAQPRELEITLRDMLAQAPDAHLEYAQFIHPDTLEPLDEITHEAVIALACHVGSVRLIDNIRVRLG